jgi:hypothetical protein
VALRGPLSLGRTSHWFVFFKYVPKSVPASNFYSDSGYMVRYWESDKDISVANNTVVYIGNRLETTISDLTPGKTYYLRVLAFSQGGEGKMSSPAWQFQMGKFMKGYDLR